MPVRLLGDPSLVLARLAQRLLEPYGELFELLVSGIELTLDLLELSLQLDVLVFSKVVVHFQITELILEILFLKLGKIVHSTWGSLLLLSKDHFPSQLLSFELLDGLSLTGCRNPLILVSNPALILR